MSTTPDVGSNPSRAASRDIYQGAEAPGKSHVSTFVAMEAATPLYLDENGVPDSGAVNDWLATAYYGREMQALEPLYRQIIEYTTETTNENERFGVPDNFVKEDKLYKDEGHFVIFDTSDYRWLCSGVCRGPRWCCKHRKLLAYRACCGTLSHFSLYMVVFVVAIAFGTTLALTWLAALIAKTYAKVDDGDVFTTLTDITTPFLNSECVEYEFEGETFCFVPLGGTIIVFAVVMWLLLGGSPYTRWTSHRLVMSLPMERDRGKPHGCCHCLLGTPLSLIVPPRCRLWTRWNWCYMPYYHHREFNLSQLENITLEQSFMQRCFDVGNIRVDVREKAQDKRVKTHFVIRDIPQIHTVFDFISALDVRRSSTGSVDRNKNESNLGKASNKYNDGQTIAIAKKDNNIIRKKTMI